jgi:hypothetical protein
VKTWLIIPTDRISELDEINAKFNDKLCSYLETNDGVLLTNSDKLNDPYWSEYHSFLSSLTPFEGQPIWPTPTEELPE